MATSNDVQAVYHERQELYRCGIHALNNVLQGAKYITCARHRHGLSGTLTSKLTRLYCTLFSLHVVLRALAKVFERATLDDACQHLAALADPSGGGNSLMSRVWNPHRSALGLGNYDVNALMYVLEAKGYTMQWVDKRRPVTKELLECDALEGVLCNVVMSGFLRSVWEQRHWFAIKKLFASENDCFKFLQELVDTGECELFSIAKAPESEAQ